MDPRKDDIVLVTINYVNHCEKNYYIIKVVLTVDPRKDNVVLITINYVNDCEKKKISIII
jgi:hypothetical protein